MSLLAYEGHFEGDRFISKDNLKIPEYKKVIITVIEEDDEEKDIELEDDGIVSASLLL